MNVLLCAIVKNAAKNLSLNLNYALQMTSLFKRYQIVIYENNSTDKTKEILRNYKNPLVKVISEDLSAELIKQKSQIWSYKEITSSDHPCRIEQITWARNKVLAEINKPSYDAFEYVIWVDFDSKGWDIKAVKESLQESHLWDVVYGNSNPYYDFYALRTENNPWGPEVLGEFWWKKSPKEKWSLKQFLQKKMGIKNKEKKYKKVFSAFNGIGIFHKKIFKNFSYDFRVNQEVQIFYRKLFKQVQNSKTLDLITKDCSIFPGGFKDAQSSIFWKNNSGYKGPVVCEHVCLNFSLQNRSYRIYTNQDLMYYH